MIDFTNIEKYHENNRIEAKKALGGLPHSIWESYSAFANTLGGVILLGVEEYRDHSLHTIDLPDPEGLVEDFWALLNDPKKASVNILSEKDVTIETVNGHHIVAIRVPRARRFDKPVYIDGNPLTGSYRRGGEGDYRCSKEEVYAMMRDAAVKTPDMRILSSCGVDALDLQTVDLYRTAMQDCRPGHEFEQLDDATFLMRIGALEASAPEEYHPTAAGLLMFGQEEEIVKEFPNFALLYRNGSDIFSSFSRGREGNIYRFYRFVKEKFSSDPNLSQYGEDILKALHEAFVNALINADYHGSEGVSVVKEGNHIFFSNPGSFRIDLESAQNGGISDPRNSALVKMFSFIDLCSGQGGGIPHIFGSWNKRGWVVPNITEAFDPDRITLTLTFEKKNACSVQEHNFAETAVQISAHRQAILGYLTEHIFAFPSEIAQLIGSTSALAKSLLNTMIEEEIVTKEETGQYRLKR